MVVLPQLTKLGRIVDESGYEEALAQIRDLGLKELILFYRRTAQMDRWAYGDSPNVLGVINASQA